MSESRRADAVRNRARILAVAEEQIDAHGAEASLEQIARVAGVGSATVRRHFPNRHALLEAVSRSRIEELAVRARELADREDSRGALLAWLDEVVVYAVAARGLAVALAYEAAAGSDAVRNNACSAALEEAGRPLLQRAAREGAVSAEVTIADLISLLVGIVLATEHHPDPGARAGELFRLAVTGLSPQR